MPSTNNQIYHCITPDDLALYLSDPTSHSYDNIQILDARFIYEYKGGKIISAINVTLFSTLVKIFERLKRDIENGKSVCVVIYCEFSSRRGPRLYDLFREYDRNSNIANHPNLSCPNLFLLKGGYNRFHELYPKLCYGEYVQMYDPEYIKNGIIRVCKKNYFSDYKEFLTMKQNQNLKLNFKFGSYEHKYSPTDIQDDQNFESQPEIGTSFMVSSNLSLFSV